MRRILYLGNDPHVISRLMTEPTSYKIESTDNAAIAILRVSSKDFDVYILDGDLTSSIDVTNLCFLIRDIHPNATIICLSREAEQSDIFIDGCHVYLQKPEGLQRLGSAIEM